MQPETRSTQKSPAMRRNVVGFVRMVSDLPSVWYRFFGRDFSVVIWWFKRECSPGVLKNSEFSHPLMGVARPPRRGFAGQGRFTELTSLGRRGAAEGIIF